MSKILIASIDSDIGVEIAQQLKDQGHSVTTTSRNGNGDYHLELAHNLSWPKLPEAEFDTIYYTIGIGDKRSTRIEVMQINAFLSVDFLGYAARAVKPGGSIVALTTLWGSISAVSNLPPQLATLSQAYKMSRAAFNMGVTIQSKRFPQLRWLLIHPGIVDTKATQGWNRNDKISAKDSAAGVINVGSLSKYPAMFMDYNGQKVDF